MFQTFTRSSSAALSNDQLRRWAPSIFANEAHASRSDRYAYIPTAEILQGLQRQGFEVYSARQARTRSADRVEHTKHMLRLRHASQIERAAVVGESVAELILINSHDGSSAYSLMGGLHRFVCANGMTVPDGICRGVKVQHSGKVQDRVIEGAFEVLDGLTRVIDSRDAMRALSLNDGERAAFARAALALRFDSDDGQAPPVSVDQVLRPRRSADVGADLWRTFNTVQEHVIKGGLSGRAADGSRRATRAVTGIDQDVKLNRALWTLAEEMRRLKA